MPTKFNSLFLLIYLIYSSEMLGQKLHLDIVGTSEKETRVIDSLDYKKSFEDYSALSTEVDALKKLLTRIGYIESNLVNLSKANDSSYMANFSLRTRYESIEIDHRGLVDKAILKLTGFLDKDNKLIIPIVYVETTLNAINTEIANRGNPFSTLIIKDIKKIDNKHLSGTLSISDPKPRTIDKFILKGYEKFPRSYIKRYLKIKEGQPFNLKTIREKTSAFNDLVFANQIREPEVLFTQDSTILYMYIDKVRSNTFDGFLGFGTNEETNKIEFDGYLDLNLTNNLNYGESLKLLYKSDENDQQTLDIKLSTPYILGSPVGLDLNLNIFKRDTSFVTVSQSAKLNYQINSRHVISAGVNSVNSSDLLDIPSALISDYKSVQYFGNYVFTKRQNYDLLFPINFVFDVKAGFGNRTYSMVDEQQYNLALLTYKIFNLNDKNSIFGKLSSNYLISESFLENELPRFGGINSIRGFEENSLTANLFAVLNTEYRYKLNNSIFIHSVIDAAYFENQITNQKGKLYGFGFGFGLLSKAGLFRFNYTSGKTENQKFRLSDSKIHISLTARF